MTDHDATVTTPVGRILLTVHDGVSTLGEGAPDTARALSRGGWLLTYRSREIEATLVVGEVVPRLPPGMSVDRCMAAVWRVRTTKPLKALCFSCRCPDLPANADGGPNSGEGLDAQTWQVPGWVISVGTQDGEDLASRARQGDNMPRQLAEQLYIASVKYTPDGMRLPLASVPADELVQVHFVVAWASRPDNEEVDQAEDRSVCPWFAVDQDSAWLLEQLTDGAV